MKTLLIFLLLVANVGWWGGCGNQNSSSKAYDVSPDAPLVSDSTIIDYSSFPKAGQSSLQNAIDNCRPGDTLILQAGTYYAAPTDYIDPLCGNCADQKTAVTASTGFTINNKNLVIIGSGKDSTILVTGAGYGIFIDNSSVVLLHKLQVTGGKRDLDGNATDAAIVVRGSSVGISDCALSDNDHREDSVVVGIGGIFGREGAQITISHSEIVNNGWDGVALYRGASAVISDCIIRKGRGAGIGVTWDAWCVAQRNEISEFWKGIGSFGTSQLIARNNLVYDNLGWGIIGTGQSYLDATNNIIHHNGNCGVAPWSQESRGRFVNNIITDNGWREEWVCPCVGIWNYGNLDNWHFFNNLIYNNAAGNLKDMPDIIGRDGNISVDPLFVGEGDFHLQAASLAIDAGYIEITDTDGSPSDLGIYGGGSARE